MENRDLATNLRNYATLLVRHGANVQRGQVVNIGAEVAHRELAYLVAEEAYNAGAKCVMLDLGEPRLQRKKIMAVTEEDLSFVPPHLEVKYRHLVDSQAANIRLIGPEYPEILSDLDPRRLNVERIALHKAVKYFYDEGIGKSKVHWVLAAAATPGWGRRIFPDLDGEQACERLWEEIFRICRVDTPDYLARWEKHQELLHRRAHSLTEMGIRDLHFKGPGTDLRVGLSPRSLWKGGSDPGPRGVPYEPNIPTEECFTTPDWRRTEGVVRTTRPFLINGKLIRGLECEFRGGELVRFTAKEGEATFREYVSSDAGAKRLGEVALVGIDSPIYQSGLVFEEILFDENAACHIAIGMAYRFCVDGGPTMSSQELEAIGCNDSTVHTDMMISSEEVDVIGTDRDGKSVTIIAKGRWRDL